MKFITWDNLSDFAFVNIDTLSGAPRGVCVNFHGFTDASMFEKSSPFAEALGKRGIIFVFPYYSVWSWLDRASVAFIDEVLDVVWDHFGLPELFPLVTAGGSMGGMVSIMYGVFGKRKTVACAADCPVVDMRCHFVRGASRAIYNAFILEDKSVEECMDERSAVRRAADLPRIPYYAVFGGADACIGPDQPRAFAKAMRAAGHDVTVTTVCGMGHCALADFPDDAEKYVDFISRNIEKQYKK